MMVYLVLGLIAALLGAWALGLLISAIVDALRPREPAPPLPGPADRIQTVRRLAEEWRGVRHHWVGAPEPEGEQRAA